MKKKIIIFSILFLVIALIVLYFVLNNISTNNKAVSVTENLTSQQAKLEKDFTSSGYTIDDPNIIVNPYDISPLTALVIF